MTITRTEEGAGTLLVLWVALLLLTTGLTATLWSAVSLTTHRAANAADLAALSAAQVLQSSRQAACPTARSTADAQRATLTHCVLNGDSVTITVAVPLNLRAFGTPQVSATARAGPVDPPPTPTPAAHWTSDR